MVSSFSYFLHRHTFLRIFLILTISTPYAIGCYTSIFGFGDSLTDTGNSYHFSSPSYPRDCVLPPYGETYFHHPTGRCCDGRIIIDFIAQNFGLPFVPPYFGGSNASEAADFEKGVNFAVVGAPTLDDSFFEERGIPNAFTNRSMRCQLSWFKDLLPSLCLTSSSNYALQYVCVYIFYVTQSFSN
uniref:GDSL esterase/lipase n=1 Tax=Davidia involucrata TaxID=16924 RepID=A0A5B7C6E4_DAVIN